MQFVTNLSNKSITLILFLLTAVFYIYTLQPSLSWGDGVRIQREAITGESFILAELYDVDIPPDKYPFARLGIAAWDHPLYVVLGYSLARAGTTLFSGTQQLWWVNLLSAIPAAGAIAMVFWLGIRLTENRAASVISASLLAVSHTFWWHAATPEVYTLHVFLLLAALACFMEFYLTESPRWLYLSGIFLGLGLANHLMTAIAIPGVLLFTASNRSVLQAKGAFHSRTLASTLGCLLFASALLPIQGVRMLRVFSWMELLGPLFGSTFFENLPPITIGESLLRYIGLLMVQFSPLGMALGMVGLWHTTRKSKPAGQLIVVLYIFYTVFSVIYRVTDQFAFHLTSYVMFALAIPFGWLELSKRYNQHVKFLVLGLLAAQVLAAPLFYDSLVKILRTSGVTEAVLEIPEIGTGVRDGLAFYLNPNMNGNDEPYVFGTDTLTALPPNAVVIAQWYTDTDEFFIFRYLKVVEGMRPDVEVEGWPSNDLFSFEPQLAINLIESEIKSRPVYLASLSEEYYRANELAQTYCIYPEHNLYRIALPDLSASEICLGR